MKRKVLIIVIVLFTLVKNTTGTIPITVNPSQPCKHTSISLHATMNGSNHYTQWIWHPTGGTTTTDTASWISTYNTYIDSTTTYTFIAISNTSTDTGYITVTIDSATITMQPTNQNIIIGQNAQFFASASGPNLTYQWQTNFGVGYQDVSNAGQYSGAYNDTLTVSNITLSNNNQYFRCIAITNGCPYDTSISALLTTTTGVDEINPNNNSFEIYPNPASTVLNIHQHNPSNNQQLIITDILGNKVYKEALTGIDNTLPISTWSAGIYFYEVKSEKESVRGKFIKQ
ncbi:MAG: T9SS type A sorting domain-containing protein [Bacteroidota bacterium]